MRIVKIEKSKRKRQRVLVYLEEGDLLRVTESELARFGLYPGMDLSAEDVVQLQKIARDSETKLQAAQISAARMLSKKELTDRLRRKGAEPEAAAAAAERMAELGAVDDAAYAGAVVRHYVALGYGKGRAEQELRRRGVPRDLWDEALAQLPEAGDAVRAYLRSRLRGRVPDRAEVKKLSDALLRRGFSWNEIRPVLNELGEMQIDSDE